MFKSIIIKEAFICSLIVLLSTYLISFIPLSLEYGKALHQGFADFDIYDLYYSGKNKGNFIHDTGIAIAEIGQSREEIAKQIKVIAAYNPKLIAIDASFETPLSDSTDTVLNNELQQHSNIVYAYGFDKAKKIVPNIFEDSMPGGYIDLSSNPDYTVIRTYSPFTKDGNTQYEAFTTTILHKADSSRYHELKNRRNNIELINYNGNLNNYFTITAADLNMNDSVRLKTLVNNKIVLLGFFVQNPPLVMDDLYYSPLNERVSGKSFPDMYGVVVHANILSMILHGRYATLASKYMTYFFAFLITFLLEMYFISRYHKRPHPSHAILILIHFIVILLVLYIFLMVFTWFQYKVPLEPVMISMVLSLELLALYKNIVLWLHKKYNYKTVFAHKHII